MPHIPLDLFFGRVAENELLTPPQLPARLEYRGGVVSEWVDDSKAIEILAVLQILTQKIPASSGLRGCHNQGVPKRQPVTILKHPGTLNQVRIGPDGVPRDQISHFGAGLAAGIGATFG